MAYTAGKSKHKETWDYWSLWNKKNRNVEKYFLAQWEDQFNRIRQICKEIEKPGNIVKPHFDHDDPYYSDYIGSVFNVTPSGKYYMAFASSNISVKEAAIDEFWREKFESVLQEEGCWDECGEGCSTDMFICKAYEPPECPHEDFMRILEEKVLIDLHAGDYLAIPGIAEILMEYYNNDVIEEWSKEVLDEGN